jgi:ornithine carbamoyltransferase
MTDLLTVADLPEGALDVILELAERPDLGRPLEGQGAALLFQKPSARTRNSMEMAVVSLGGHPISIRDEEVGLGSRESPEDVARTLACYHRVIAARVFDHALLERMAAAVDIPVVNLLSDRAHPMQALADLLTLRQLLGELKGVRVAYVGDANNVCRSLAEACVQAGVRLAVAAPQGFALSPGELARLNALGEVTQTAYPMEAVRGARAVYTDTWTSMGQEAEAASRRRSFAAFQVDERLMAAADDAWFLHCLPAHRGEEVTDAVLDSPRSAVWRQAENRLHAARGALAWILGGGS